MDPVALGRGSEDPQENILFFSFRPTTSTAKISLFPTNDINIKKAFKLMNRTTTSTKFDESQHDESAV